jgi:putative hydrolase of the HAD superfamily
MGVCVPIDFIWFDLGYTLLYKDREKLLAEVLSRFAINRSIEEIDRAFHAIDKRFMREFPGYLGRSSEEFMPLYFGFLCRYLNICGDLVSLLNAWINAWKTTELGWVAYPQVPGVLDRLASIGKRLGVISNWDPSAKPILAGLGLLDRFEIVVISCEVGVSKPDERIFRIALEQAKIAPERCLYIGDNYYDDTVGASSVGMRSLIVNRFGSFGVEELSGQRLITDISGIIPYIEEES